MNARNMHVYRYRNASLLSQKGLIYDEWYFASKEELNDPIDMQSNFEFSPSCWLPLLSRLWEKRNYVEAAASYLSSISPISYEKLMREFSDIRLNVTLEVIKHIQLSTSIYSLLERDLRNLHDLVDLYEPDAGYSVSLSRINTSMLMWSHYSQSHTGFCLVYRPIKGRLGQCPNRKKESLTLSPGCSLSIPIDFLIEDVIYEDKVLPLDATNLMPVAYSTNQFSSDEEKKEWHRMTNAQLLTKNTCWSYEDECRLMLPKPSKWLSGNNKCNSLQRLFHYDFQQVVGVIFGARMSQGDKESIRNIIDYKIDNKIKAPNNDLPRHHFDFLYQQAEICASSREVKIVDLDINYMGRNLQPDAKGYGDRLAKWKNGEGFTFHNGAFSYDPIPWD